MKTILASAAFVVTLVAAPSPAIGAPSKEMPITTKSKDALAAFVAARDLQEQSRAPEAEPLFKKAVTLDADFAQARTYLLGYMSPTDRVVEADKIAALSKSLPESERVYVDMNLAGIRGDDNAVIADEKKLGELLPDDWRVQAMLGSRAAGDHKLDEAVLHYKRAAELNPKAGGSTWGGLGYAYLQQHKNDDAVLAFKKWAEVTPTDPNAYDSLGDAQRMAGKQADAEASYKKALEVDPKFSTAWTGVAMTRVTRGDVLGALDAMQQYVASTPRELDKPGAVLELAYWQVAAGKGADAEKSIATVEKLVLEQKRASTYAFVDLDHAAMLLAQNKPKDALKLVDEAAVRLAKAENVSGGNQLGFQFTTAAHRLRAYALLADKEGAKKSEADLEAVLQKFPSEPIHDSQRHEAKGDLALAGGDAKGAVAEYRQCLPESALCLAKGIEVATKLHDDDAAKAMRVRLADNLQRDNETLRARLLAGAFPSKPPK